LNARQRIVLATKVGGRSGDGDPPGFIGVSAKNIIRQCELSLLQLKTDWIDLLQLHLPGEIVEIDEQLDALDRLRQKGVIRYYGVCNHSANQMDDLYAAEKRKDLSGLVSHQFSYNLLEQLGRKELFAQCTALQIGSIIWGPLSSGLLSDRYAINRNVVEQSRIGIGRERISKELLLQQQETQNLLCNLVDQSKREGISLQSQAIKWLLQNDTVDTILLGPSNLSQLLELLEVEKI